MSDNVISDEMIDRINEMYAPPVLSNKDNIIKQEVDEGFVYIISNRLLLQKGLVKIGFAKNYTRRLYSHNSSSPYDFVYLALFRCTDYEKIEASMHHDCKKYHFNREFFRMGPSDIHSLCKKYEDILYKKDDKIIRKLSKRLTFWSAYEYSIRIKQLQSRVKNMTSAKTRLWTELDELKQENEDLKGRTPHSHNYNRLKELKHDMKMLSVKHTETKKLLYTVMLEKKDLEKQLSIEKNKNKAMINVPLKLSELERLNTQLDSKNTALTEQVQHYESELERLNTQLDYKDSTIRDLESTIRTTERERDSYERHAEWFENGSKEWKTMFYDLLYKNHDYYTNGYNAALRTYDDYWDLYEFHMKHNSLVQKLFNQNNPLKKWMIKHYDLIRGLIGNVMKL